jgi:hypothetical protein
MVSLSNARSLASSLPGVEEKSHFQTPDFRVRGKIFASLHADKNIMMVKLNLVDQSVFCAIDKLMIFPVPGGWGKRGATFIDLKKVKKSILEDALLRAWKNVAPSKLIQLHFPLQ